MLCPNCGSTQHEFLLIDCTLSGEARERIRYCFDCKKEARHPYANCLPQVIRNLDIPEAEKQAAFRARRYAVDRRASYPIAERLFDLGFAAENKD